ncbi:MAG: globin-coupled sensor protein [Pseudomonadota bacterium]
MVDARSKFESRLNFIGFSEADARALRSLHSVVKACLPGVLDAFYADLAGHPEIYAMFGSEAGVAHAKEKQLEHWLKIVSARFDADYEASVGRIGAAHARLDLKPEWYFGAYNQLMIGMAHAVLDQERAEPMLGRWRKAADGPRSKVAALIKAVMLDMELVMSVIDDHRNTARRNQFNKLASEFESQIAAIAETLAASSGKLAGTAQDMSSTAQRTNEQSAQVASAAESASGAAQSVAGAAGELSQAIAEISARAGEAAEDSSTASDEARRTGETMAKLSEAAAKIDEIVSLIESVAGQTNLLALNATIEAARAGEAGKGFAVVASEVKSLAAQTATATENISSSIGEVQAVVADAVRAIEAVSAAVMRVNDVSASISAAVEEQNAATAEIGRTTDTAARSATAVSETIADVRAGAETTSRSADAVVGAAEALGEQSEQLRSEVAQFLERIRAA